MRVNGRWPDGTYVVFPASQIPHGTLGQSGTLEFWVMPDHDSNDGGIRRWLSVVGTPNAFSIGVYWRGWDQLLRYEFRVYGQNDWTILDLPNSVINFNAGDLIHIAVAWDISGIDGSSDTFRAYFDGELKGAVSTPWPLVDNMGDIRFGGADYSQDATIDNLKIWNLVKTDFSDRFNE